MQLCYGVTVTLHTTDVSLYLPTVYAKKVTAIKKTTLHIFGFVYLEFRTV
jgi:hypothetical protein